MKHLLGIFIILLNFCTTPSWGQEDSLMKAMGVYEKLKATNLPQSDTALALEVQVTVSDVIQTQPHLAVQRAHLLLKLSKKLNFPNGISAGFLQLGNTLLNVQELDSAEFYIDQAINYTQKNNRRRQLMIGWSLRGNLGYYRSDYDQALEDYFAALKVADEYYPSEASEKYGSVGLVFWTIGNLEKAQTYLEKSYKLGAIYKDTSAQVYALNNLGIVCRNQGKLDEAEKYFNIGLELAVTIGSLRREGEFVYNLANVHFDRGESEKGFELLARSAEITEIIGTNRDKAIEYANYGQHLYAADDFRGAYENSLIGLEYARLTNYWEVEIEALEVLANSSYMLHKYKEAFEYSSALFVLQDSLDLNSVNTEALAVEEAHREEQQALQDSLLKEKFDLEEAHQKRLNDEKVRAKDNLLIAAVAVILLVILGIVFLFRINKKVKQKNQIITERNNVITQQKDEIEEQHQEIRDSINYAQRIQTALISGNEEWDKISLNHFILFKPKDVVSGDFYWAHHSEEDNKSIWVTADCTGHGVPGAFMSVLGIGFLNEIVVESGNRNGGEILDQLRTRIIKALEQKGGNQQQKDGMDLALCIWDKTDNTLEFTGANNGLYLIRKSEAIDTTEFDKIISHGSNGYSMIELRANKMPVGLQSDRHENFKSKKIQLQENDMIISFTDGYADQFGGAKGKKFKYKPFKELLLDIHSKPVKLQGTILDEEFAKWKGDLEQIDDICIIGVRV